MRKSGQKAPGPYFCLPFIQALIHYLVHERHSSCSLARINNT
ncbi:hypothetical protein NBRC111894_549 [Sporolactobacillus inulinus]|uniref:Uncharacterized protein n=1 Tax=Sporolactobacillus inulinus TaxID=2078 RepID=A0A4Y1Z7N5_9BACL|nr:hypothetical protein NBRC111894_549 [Sporolactobacillus inulinus]